MTVFFSCLIEGRKRQIVFKASSRTSCAGTVMEHFRYLLNKNLIYIIIRIRLVAYQRNIFNVYKFTWRLFQ